MKSKITLAIFMLMFSFNNLAADIEQTIEINMCVGDSITLYGVPSTGICYTGNLYWSIQPFGTNTEGFFTYLGDNNVSISPTESMTVVGASPGISCPSPAVICFFGPTPSSYQTPMIVQEGIITYYEITVEQCDSTQVDGNECSLPYTGNIIYNYCLGEQFFFIELEDGTLLDPYFADGLDFAHYQGQLVNFNYELADFDSPCGAAIPAITLTCIEEHPDSSPIGVDIGVTKITAPNGAVNELTPIEVKVTNYGSELITNFEVRISINGTYTDLPFDNYNGEFHPGTTVIMNVGSYDFDPNENYLIKASTFYYDNDIQGLPDVNRENDFATRAYINDGTKDNLYIVCKGDIVNIVPSPVTIPQTCYDFCPTGECITCTSIIFDGYSQGSPLSQTDCIHNCDNYTITAEKSDFFIHRDNCGTNFSETCHINDQEFIIVVVDCDELDNPNAECDFTNIGTIRFEECNGGIYYLIDQADGSTIDPYFAFGVDFNYYDGQIVAYDYQPSAIIPCVSNATAVTVTCIEDVDLNASSDAGVTRINNPFFVPDGNATVVLSLKNYGTDVLETVVINWSVNGEEQEPYYYSADKPENYALQPGDSTIVYLSNYYFEPIDYTIAAHTSKPNGIPDPDPYNDLAVTNLYRGYTTNDTLHWGTYALPENDVNNVNGVNIYIPLPAQNDGCSIPTTPQVSPNSNWTVNNGNNFQFTPTENTTYSITYEGNCETYVYTVTVYIGEIPPTYSFSICRGDTVSFPIPTAGLDPNGQAYVCDGGLLSGNLSTAHMDNENIYFYPQNASIYNFQIPASSTCPGLENIFSVYVSDCSPEPEGCGPLTGTIFFEPCNNDIYYFIEMADGTILDPYNGTGINYPYDVEGVQVNFDYIDAAFTSPCNGATAVIITCIEEIEPTANVDFKILLEGPFDENLGLMKTDLLTQNLLPTQQPFNSSPYDYNGTETVSNFPTNTVDWVLVEARAGTPNTGSGNPGTIMIEAKAGLLLSDGSIVDPETFGSLIFENPVFGQSYHFIVRHRNHLDVMTSVKLTIGQNVSYDFTTSGAQTLGTEQTRQLSNGKYAMFAGDFNKDGVIQTTDFDRWYLNPAALSQYINVDANLDGISQISDRDAWYNNRSKLGVADVRQ